MKRIKILKKFIKKQNLIKNVECIENQYQNFYNVISLLRLIKEKMFMSKMN